jgi:AAA+ superfamily predicted ATPase
MNREELIQEALRLPPSAISYYVTRQLMILFPNKTITECDDGYFDVANYIRNGQCHVAVHPNKESEFLTNWEEPDILESDIPLEGRLTTSPYNAWLDITWQEEMFTVLTLHWETGDTTASRQWLITNTEQTAQDFIKAVCQWNAEIRGEILVFDDGCWQKDERLFKAIKSATFDNLILQDTLKQEIQFDLEQFFSARDVYDRFHIPWKRGILFIGPSGNGKTHTIKALVNYLQKPCLYVKGFHNRFGTDDSNINNVFLKARKSAPCVLVLEDLDSLLTEENRSFFLNELDGFASNLGIVILASTNHPEKLDQSILERPSRFDRKYYFKLPALPERTKYIAYWNDSLEESMRLSEQGILDVAQHTNNFSFAYLKELFLSSIMKWITASEKNMELVMQEQILLLQQQMANEPTP